LKKAEPVPRRIVIVGNNATGTSVASAARKQDRKAEISVVDRGTHTAYSRCGLPYVLAGEIPSFDDLITFPTSFYNMMKIDLRLEAEVTAGDVQGKTITVEQNGRSEQLPYDSLVLATGANNFIPPVKGHDKEGVYGLRTIEDGKKIQQAMKNAKYAVVVGAGFIGLETAHAFIEKGITTTVVEMLPYVLPAMFDKDMADFTQTKLEEHGLRVIVGKPLGEIVGTDQVEGARVDDELIDADMVIMATGVRANLDLAKQMGLTLGVRDRTIQVNSRMETSAPGIYAAGDCVESRNMVTGLPTISQLGTTAVRQAKVAGINAAGGYTLFPGVLSSAVTRMFGFEVGATGVTEFQANRAGLQTVIGRLTSTTKPHYFPGGKEIRVKIIAEKELGRVVGGQIVGGEDVAHRVNMISLAIQNRMTAADLAKADTCYAPPVADTWEALALAAEMAATRLRR
jgi:NADH oxidase (H2O2-forming)